MTPQVAFEIAQCLEWFGSAIMVTALQLVIQWLHCRMRWTRPVIKAMESIAPGSLDDILVVVMLRPTAWWAFSLEVQMSVFEPKGWLRKRRGRPIGELESRDFVRL